MFVGLLLGLVFPVHEKYSHHWQHKDAAGPAALWNSETQLQLGNSASTNSNTLNN